MPAPTEPGPFSSAPPTAAKPPRPPKKTTAVNPLNAPDAAPGKLTLTPCTATAVQTASAAVTTAQLSVPKAAPADTSTLFSSEQHRLSPAGADTPSPAQADQLHTPTTGAATPAATPAATLSGAPAALSSPVRPMWAGHADTGAHHTAAAPVVGVSRKSVVCTFIWGSAARAQRSARASQGTAVEFCPPASEPPVGGANPLKVCASHSIPCTSVCYPNAQCSLHVGEFSSVTVVVPKQKCQSVSAMCVAILSTAYKCSASGHCYIHRMVFTRCLCTGYAATQGPGM